MCYGSSKKIERKKEKEIVIKEIKVKNLPNLGQKVDIQIPES